MEGMDHQHDEQQQHPLNDNNNDVLMDSPTATQPYYNDVPILDMARTNSNDRTSSEDDEESSNEDQEKEDNDNDLLDDNDGNSVDSEVSEEELFSRLLLGRGPMDISYGKIESVVDWIKSGQCRNILILSGAGVSCSAGIPDFRSPGTGLYDNLQRFNLPFPQAVFDLNFFRNNPQPFVTLASELWPGGHNPTLTHSFVRLLHHKGLLLRNYTQNIDGLEVLAGVPTDKIIECHGNFRSAKCIQCKIPFPPLTAQDLIVKHRRVPICTFCGGYVKPDIVFFGEGLPQHMFSLLKGDLMKVDMVIVMGTSLTVAPVSHIPSMAPTFAKRLLINKDLVGDFCMADWDDVFLSGDCDQSVLNICKELGWEEELRAVNESTKIAPTRINQQIEVNDNTTTKNINNNPETLPVTPSTAPPVINEIET